MLRRTFASLPFVGLLSLADAAVPASLIVAVEFTLRGQAAERVAEQIARPLERAFSRLAGLRTMRSVSSASSCLIELDYAGSPTPEALGEARSMALAAWRDLDIAVPEPSITVRESRLA